VNIDTSIVCVFLSAVLAVNGWMLVQIVKLNAQVAVILSRLGEQ
jgi:hypothetical protein